MKLINFRYLLLVVPILLILSPQAYADPMPDPFPAESNSWVLDAGLSASIKYELTNLGGNQWQYTYYITNLGETNPDAPYNQDYYIAAFAIDPDDREDNYSPNPTAPTAEPPWVVPGTGENYGWTDFAKPNDKGVEWVADNPGLPSDGLIPEGYEWGIPGNTFSYKFKWTGPGTPGPGYQRFAVHFKWANPIPDEYGVGKTSGWYVGIVPEPSTVVLIVSGLAILLCLIRRRRK